MSDNADNLLNEELDDTNVLEDLNESEYQNNSKFSCPNCGDLSQDDVLFLCNTCSSSDLIHKDGIYICPSCLLPGENFECVLCGSKEVKMLS